MAEDFASITLNQDRLNRALRAFADRHMPELSRDAVVKVGFDVVHETTTLLNGHRGLPKRIDTGRLRAGWRVALAQVDGTLAASMPGSPSSQATDGDADLRVTPQGAALTVANNVEYAPFVELGTVHMAPGLHLTTGLRQTAMDLESTLGDWRDDFSDRWHYGD